MNGLAERLGLESGARALVVNCDDFGALHAINEAVDECLNDGAATGATLMVPCPWAADAAARVQPGQSIGVHLTVTSEWAGYRWGPLTDAPSLRAADGRMHRTSEAVHGAVRAAGARGLAELRAELTAQVDQALAWGIDVTHLDAHMGAVQLDREFFGIALELAVAHDLPMRMVGASGDAKLGFGSRAEATAAGILFPDTLVPTYLGAREVIERYVRSLRPGITEVMLHPSHDSPELRAAFDDADERVANWRFLVEPGGLGDLCAEHGVVLVSYRQLRDAQRA